MISLLKRLRQLCPLSIRDWLIFAASMFAGSVICWLLQTMTTSDVHVPMIFVLVVIIISMLTEGYFYGILAAVASVIAVNWAFTYPYMKLDFTIYGYPLTFFTMLAVGIIASALTTGLKEQQKLRLEAEREKTRATLLRSISHDLRTSLTAISGSISSVLEDQDVLTVEERTELLQNAKNDTDWLYRVVENLLSITRINGKNQITKTDEILEEILSETVQNFKKHHPDIETSIQIPEEPIFIPVDATLIKQVIINILDNAVTHGKTTSRILISAEEQNSLVSITFSDNGEGINPKILDHLFDSSLEDTFNTDSNRFMGIGLAVCKTIISAHDGTITAGNNPEGGARFTITLPVLTPFLENTIESEAAI